MTEIKSKSLTKNSLFYLFYNFLNIVFPLVTGIYVARILLPLNIGQIESARNLSQYFVILAFLGIPTYGLREIAKARNDKDSLSKVYSELITINAISTLTFGIIYYSIIFFIPYYRDKIVLYSITGISIALNFLNNSWLYEGLEEFGFISFRNLFFKICSFILLVLLVRNQNDYIWYAIITVFGTAGNYLLNVIHSRKFVKFSFKNINLKRHLKPIMFLVVVNLAIEIYSLVDVTMLGFMCDEETVAFYSYGMRIFKIILQLINTFTIVIVPRLSFYYKEKKETEYNKLITKTLKVLLLFSIPCVIGIWSTSGFLLPSIYGEKYARSSFVLNILSLILIFSPVGYLLGSRVLLSTGNEKKMIYPVIIGAVTNIICNTLLIQLYKEIGAALASLIGELAVMISYLLLSKNKYKIYDTSQTIIRIVISSLAMIVFLKTITLLFSYRLLITVVQILGSIILYFGILIASKEETVFGVLSSIKRTFFRKDNLK